MGGLIILNSRVRSGVIAEARAAGRAEFPRDAQISEPRAVRPLGHGEECGVAVLPGGANVFAVGGLDWKDEVHEQCASIPISIENLCLQIFHNVNLSLYRIILIVCWISSNSLLLLKLFTSPEQ